jgi:CheY-like chemotaxis protein
MTAVEHLESQDVRVFLVDDHELLRGGISALLEDEPGFRVVGEAGSASDAMARIPQAQPDLVLLDVRLGRDDGVDVCQQIRSQFPQIKVLMLTSFDDQDAILESIAAGAAGYALKSGESGGSPPGDSPSLGQLVDSGGCRACRNGHAGSPVGPARDRG